MCVAQFLIEYISAMRWLYRAGGAWLVTELILLMGILVLRREEEGKKPSFMPSFCVPSDHPPPTVSSFVVPALTWPPQSSSERRQKDTGTGQP